MKLVLIWINQHNYTWYSSYLDPKLYKNNQELMFWINYKFL